MKINLGGGQKKIKGYTNLDLNYFSEVDLVCDFNFGIPLKDNSVSEIVANHILEHLHDSVHIFSEMHRVCKPHAIIKFKSPYYNSIGAFKDPTHKSFFTEETLYYFSKYERLKRNLPDYGFNFDYNIKQI